jgi:hypothetical protein
MSIPKLSVPTYYVTVPSNKKKIKFRPFLAKEERILLLIKQGENITEMLRAMKDIIKFCSFEKLNTLDLSLFDIDYIFLQLRSKSVGEIIEFEMACTEEVEKDGKMEKCNGTIPFKINLSDIKVDFPKEHKTTFIIQDDIGIELSYPNLEQLERFEKNEDLDDISVIKETIKWIFDADNIYPIEEITEEELDEFVGTIPINKINEIRESFFMHMPALRHTVKYKCLKCGKEGEHTFEGIADFFF